MSILEKFEMVIFDLDGVLIDSREMWLHIQKKALKEVEYYFSDEEIKNQLGKRTKEIASALIPDEDKEKEEKIKKVEKIADKMSNQKKNYKKVKINKNSKKILEKIKGKNKKLVLLTNADRNFVEIILKENSLYKYWAKIIAADDGFDSKADAIKYLMKKFSTKKEETVYIGDMVRDIKVARKSGCKIISIPGWDGVQKLKKQEPDYLADSLEDLI